jgi:hypothetical protein
MQVQPGKSYESYASIRMSESGSLSLTLSLVLVIPHSAHHPFFHCSVSKRPSTPTLPGLGISKPHGVTPPRCFTFTLD